MSSKVIENKEEKKQKLMDAAYSLFKEKGVNDTSIQEIVDKAGVAKGTFYLYFKDKYDAQDCLIVNTSKKLFESAIKYVDKKKIKDFKDRLIAIIDYIIDYLKDNPDILKFLSKYLSLGVYSDKVSNLIEGESIGVLDVFKKGINESNLKIENPDITLFMIIELTSSVVFSSITLNKPLPIDEIKPFLYKKIIAMLNE